MITALTLTAAPLGPAAGPALGPPLALLCGAGFGAGLLLIASFLIPGRSAEIDGTTADSADMTDTAEAGRGWRVRVRRWREDDAERTVVRLALIAAAAVVVGLITRWPVAAILAAAGGWALPGLLRKDPRQQAQVAQLEAIATWTEMLRDTIAAAAGLEQAVAASATTAPQPIRAQVVGLHERLQRGDRLPAALRSFAEEVGDASCDLVVAALVMASQHQGRQLGELLASLASATRDQVGMRLRVSATRARTQTSVRVIVGATVAMAAGLALLNRAYLAPYDSVLGQLVLLLIGGLFAAGLAWLRRISAFIEAPRVLTRVDALTYTGRGASTSTPTGART